MKVTTQFPYGWPVQPEDVLSKWHNDCGVLAREKCKIIWYNWVMLQKMRKKLYGNWSRHIMSSLLNMKNLSKWLLFLPYRGHIKGSDMHSTSSTFNLVFHYWIGVSSSHQTNRTPSNNYIPLQKPYRSIIEWKS
jgi:hypothetical protein